LKSPKDPLALEYSSPATETTGEKNPPPPWLTTFFTWLFPVFLLLSMGFFIYLVAAWIEGWVK
jgi:hypothetical protein